MLSRCYLCGRPLSGKVNWDHVVPKSKGGKGLALNLLPTHKRCNSRKRDAVTADMIAKARFYQHRLIAFGLTQIGKRFYENRSNS